MEYNCKTISLHKLAFTEKGIAKSLCDNCVIVDCTNPIEIRKVSMLGVTNEHKVYVRGNDICFVIECQGVR